MRASRDTAIKVCEVDWPRVRTSCPTMRAFVGGRERIIKINLCDGARVAFAKDGEG